MIVYSIDIGVCVYTAVYVIFHVTAETSGFQPVNSYVYAPSEGFSGMPPYDGIVQYFTFTSVFMEEDYFTEDRFTSVLKLLQSRFFHITVYFLIGTYTYPFISPFFTNTTYPLDHISLYFK